jgi:hypothetical protein
MAKINESRLQEIFYLIDKEFREATDKFGPFNGPHEGYAVILEELDELWDAIKNNEPGYVHMAEAKQVAAMAVRYIYDIVTAD